MRGSDEKKNYMTILFAEVVRVTMEFWNQKRD